MQIIIQTNGREENIMLVVFSEKWVLREMKGDE